ncbi:hypothetical protein [Haliovirga abyssi]|uniref:Uncharacterized protein n=1 Tax=Haliovirga abyssi TaxID=2996794 RepID=A0AAU9E4A5_9FUSO|nr:hypothetical protein [Haliovirga abyssi]BDU51330.1 hypothetical protein HLVA_18990 [Haliovirga abyssi]
MKKGLVLGLGAMMIIGSLVMADEGTTTTTAKATTVWQRGTGKQNPNGQGRNFVDKNGDGINDNFVDANGDGINDNRPAYGRGYGRNRVNTTNSAVTVWQRGTGRANPNGQGRNFVDKNGDGINDNFVDANGDGINDNRPAYGKGNSGRKNMRRNNRNKGNRGQRQGRGRR